MSLTCFFFFLPCKLLERRKTWQSVFYSHAVLLSETGELILCLCQFLSFHFWPPNLNYKQILPQLLFYHFLFDCMQNSFTGCLQLSFHPSLYLLLFWASFCFFFFFSLPHFQAPHLPEIFVTLV